MKNSTSRFTKQELKQFELLSKLNTEDLKVLEILFKLAESKKINIESFIRKYYDKYNIKGEISYDKQ